MEKELGEQLMRRDLQESLQRHYIDPRKLSTLQRILLTTDGTVTEILEAYLYEKMQVVKLSQEMIILQEDIGPMDLKKGDEVIERKILLQGKVSLKNFVYAQSIIVPGRFDQKVQKQLEKSRKPVGQLWLEHKVETFREILDSGKVQANELAGFFQVDEQDMLLHRTYRVFSKGLPIIMITEKFPESFFLNNF
jgi:chorismate-pyruvate lyase